jgi:hypothetical protein
MSHKPESRNLHLVRSAGSFTRRLGSLEIVAAKEHDAPFICDAVVVEQDRCLILGDPKHSNEPDRPPWFLANQLASQHLKTPGTVYISGKSPAQINAIIHDVDHDPSWRAEWIISAYRCLFQMIEAHGMSSLCLPVLGTKHGGMTATQGMELLISATNRRFPFCLKRLWLIRPNDAKTDLLSGLETFD